VTHASFLRDIVAFSVQIAFVVAAIAALLKIVAIPARARYVCLRLALLACLLVPWWLRSTIVVTPASERVTGAAAIVPVMPFDTSATPPVTAASAPVAAVRGLPWASLLLLAVAFGIVVRGAWLVIGFKQLRWLNDRAVPVDAPEYADAQEQVGTSAAIAHVDRLAQPVTFGVRRPVVLLPEALNAAPVGLRRAVVIHELFHVRRRDWLSLLAEEVVRSVLWFHPAILWLTSQIQLAREELVDELTVRATGDRRSYMKALLAFADSGGLRPAPAFAQRRHLFQRILSVSKEKVMSAPRIVLSAAALLAALGGSSWYASTLFPIVAAVYADPDPVNVNTLSRQASALAVAPTIALPGDAFAQGSAASAPQTAPHAVTPENPIPRRTRGASPVWPSQFAGQPLQVVVSALVTVDRDGAVTSVVRDNCTVSTRSDSGEGVCRVFFDATAAAIRQWRYERPARAPLQFPIMLMFRPGTEATVNQAISAQDWVQYVRETQASLRALAEQTRSADVVDQNAIGPLATAEFLKAELDRVSAQLREVERAYRLALERGVGGAQLQQAHAEIARLNDDLGRAAAQQRSTNEGADENRQRLAAQLRAAEARLNALRQQQAERDATVRPTPASPFDGSPQLVSPSGRAPIRVGGTILEKMPVPTKRVQPVYTAEVMRARIQGTVPVEVLVDEQGKVADARVLRSIPLLDDAALAAAKQWEFTPTLLNGEPVPVLLMLEMNFVLR
jgi:TonB family protein